MADISKIKLPDGNIYDVKDTSKSSATNWVNGSTTGSVRTTGSKVEDNDYTIGTYAVTEGKSTAALGYGSHAEGYFTTAKNQGSHSEGDSTTASGAASHAEGKSTTASQRYTHAEGYQSRASGDTSHAEGNLTTASGMYSHAEGLETTAAAYASHAQNSNTIASKAYQTVIGKFNIEDTASVDADQKALIVGNGTSNSSRSNALTVDWSGNVDIASGAKYKINGTPLAASDVGAQSTLVSGTNIKTINGNSLLGSGDITITGGLQNLVDGSAEGSLVGVNAGSVTTNPGTDSLALGYKSDAAGVNSVAAGYWSSAGGNCSFALGDKLIAQRKHQTVIGKFNIADTGGTDATTDGDSAFIIGNGTSEQRSNALTVDWNGNAVLAGKVTVGAVGTNSMDVATVGQIPSVPSNLSDLVNDCGFAKIHISTAEPTSTDGDDGDIWITYSATS